MDLNSYKSLTQNYLDLSNPKHVLHVIATIGYHEDDTAPKSRAISLLRISAKESNSTTIECDHFAFGAYKSLISAMKDDGTTIEYLDDGNIVINLL